MIVNRATAGGRLTESLSSGRARESQGRVISRSHQPSHQSRRCRWNERAAAAGGEERARRGGPCPSGPAGRGRPRHRPGCPAGGCCCRRPLAGCSGAGAQLSWPVTARPVSAARPAALSPRRLATHRPARRRRSLLQIAAGGRLSACRGGSPGSAGAPLTGRGQHRRRGGAPNGRRSGHRAGPQRLSSAVLRGPGRTRPSLAGRALL